MTKEEKEDQLFRDRCLEYPFKRPGMKDEEFKEEMLYFMEHFKEYQAGIYNPLWKQANIPD